MVSRTAEQRVFVPMLRASWSNLTFVHWRLAPEEIQALLPSGLTVDEYDGAAWLGLTPFIMGNMRPPGVPDLARGFSFVPVPKQMRRLRDLSSTPETNLRTYVRGPDGRDGLYFVTLDIGNPVVAAILRAVVGAPYHYARLTVERQGHTVTYTGSRIGASQYYRLQVHPGEPIQPSEFEVWLTSRWRTYTTHLGRLLVTPVEHEPWPLREAGLGSIEENLTDAVGLDGLAGPPLVHFSDGVHMVRVGRPAVLLNR